MTKHDILHSALATKKEKPPFYTKHDILCPALAARKEELLLYQVNITNYTLAIQEIEANHPNDENLQKFKAELQERLTAEREQEARARIIYDVILKQVNQMEGK